ARCTTRTAKSSPTPACRSSCSWRITTLTAAATTTRTTRWRTSTWITGRRWRRLRSNRSRGRRRRRGSFRGDCQGGAAREEAAGGSLRLRAVWSRKPSVLLCAHGLAGTLIVIGQGAVRGGVARVLLERAGQPAQALEILTALQENHPGLVTQVGVVRRR